MSSTVPVVLGQIGQAVGRMESSGLTPCGVAVSLQTTVMLTEFAVNRPYSLRESGLGGPPESVNTIFGLPLVVVPAFDKPWAILYAPGEE